MDELEPDFEFPRPASNPNWLLVNGPEYGGPWAKEEGSLEMHWSTPSIWWPIKSLGGDNFLFPSHKELLLLAFVSLSAHGLCPEP